MKRTIIILLFVSILIAAAGVFIMTDMGQLFGISKSIIVYYFNNNNWIIFLSFAALATAFLLNRKHRVFKIKSMALTGLLWVVLVLSTKYVTPYIMFGATQEGAEFIQINEAKDYLQDDEIVFVIDRNGVQKAYPRSYIWQTHIVGGDFGGEEIVMTYCVLANLPTPFVNEINGSKVNFKVLAQTNNNLLIWDRASGEIIQQITQTCEFSENRLDPVPVMEMTWQGFKKAYPDGTVFYNQWDSPIEIALDAVMPLEENFTTDQWMFKTVNFDDKRFETKDMIIGVSDPDSEDYLAISKPLLMKEKQIEVNVGSKHFLVVYFDEFDATAAFSLEKNGQKVTVDEIDINGMTKNHGQLDRAYVFNSVFWGVWSWYFPDTEVIS